MISKRSALTVLNVGLETGADYAEIFDEETIKSKISYDNKKIETVGTTFINGIGLRLVKDNHVVYGYTNDLSDVGLVKLAETLNSSFKGERVLEVKELSKVRTAKKHSVKIQHNDKTKAEIADYLIQAGNYAYAYDPRIVRASATISMSTQKVGIYTSEGHLFQDVRIRTRLNIEAIAKDGEAMESGMVAPGGSIGLELLERYTAKELATEAATLAINALSAKPCPSGKMPVIIGNGFGGVLFHEACGHSLEATSVAPKLSVFSNKMGTVIASKIVTAYDDGTIPNAWGSENIDDEGNASQNNILIKKGVLTSYLVDRVNGAKMGVSQTGSSRRESYRYAPTSRMTNTFIGNGTSTVEEIISNTKFGLYAKSMAGGSVDPATGEFNFAVREGYIIQDGAIAYQVKGASIIGQGKDVLLHIDMIANDLERAQGMCGSVSGSIPTDVGQPTLRVSEIIVGGTGGKINE